MEGTIGTSLFLDPLLSDDERRAALYDGHVVVHSKLRAVSELVQFARALIEQAFAPLDPQRAQDHMPVERFAGVLNELKPSFIHHPESKRLVAALLTELGCDPAKTYFDVPRLRSSTSGGYLTSGIAYAWHPHRDTWYSAPACQLNFWLPVYDLRPDNAMAFHTAYFRRGVRNTSEGYNYYTWNKSNRGAHVAQYTKADPRPLPKPTEHVELEPQLVVLPPVGGVMLFSAGQMHSSVPNSSGVTRYSIDFRTVHLDDARQRLGAPNVDAACTGTTMRDYLRVDGLSPIPEDVIALYDDSTNVEGELVYRPAAS